MPVNENRHGKCATEGIDSQVDISLHDRAAGACCSTCEAQKTPADKQACNGLCTITSS